MSPVSLNGEIKEQCHPEWGTRLGWGRRLETTTLLSSPQLPPPNPQIKNEHCSAGALPSGRPFSVAQVCNAFWAPASSRFIVPAPQPAGSPRPGARAAPWKGVGGGALRIPYPLLRVTQAPSHPHLLPANLSLKRNGQSVSGR